MVDPSISRLATAAVAAGLVCSSLACSSSDQAERDDETGLSRPQVTTAREGEYLVQRFDIDGNGETDVFKYFEEYPSSDDPDVTKRRIRKKEVDVNGNNQIDIVKEYNKEGVPVRETVDTDLDGTDDVVRHFENGSLSRKDLLGDDGETVVGKRFYTDGDLRRVEKDTNDDGKVDHWEYYQDGKLQRIGRDADGDEEIDKWVHRE